MKVLLIYTCKDRQLIHVSYMLSGPLFGSCGRLDENWKIGWKRTFQHWLLLKKNSSWGYFAAFGHNRKHPYPRTAVVQRSAAWAPWTDAQQPILFFVWRPGWQDAGLSYTAQWIASIQATFWLETMIFIPKYSGLDQFWDLPLLVNYSIQIKPDFNPKMATYW